MIFALEGLRGVAALLVALYHAGRETLHAFGLVNNAWLCVDVFFVVSGFVMSHVYGRRLSGGSEAASFLVKRVGRLYPLHVVTLASIIAVTYGVQLLKLALLATGLHTPSTPPEFDALDLWPLVTNLLLIQSMGVHDQLTYNYPAWSISTEFWTYVLFALTALAVSVRRRPALWLVCAVAGIAVLLVQPRHHEISMTYDYGWFRCVYGFFLGALLPPFVPRLRRLPAKLLGAFQVAALVAAVTAIWTAHLVPRLTFAYPALFALLVLAVATDSGPVARWLARPSLQWLGKVSYSTYMVHVTVGVVTRPLTSWLPSPWDAWIQLPLYTAAVLGTAALTYRYVEAPWRDRARDWADARWSRVAKQPIPVPAEGS